MLIILRPDYAAKGAALENNRTLSRDLLEDALADWTPRIRNPTAALFAAEAAVLLGFNDLVDAFLGFAGELHVRDMADIEKEHPFVDDDYLGRVLDPIESRDYAKKFRGCSTDYDRECFLITLLLNRQNRLALRLSWRLPRYRRRHLRFVATIEAFRCGDYKTGQRLLKRLPRSTMCIWGKPQMAIGISGRAGWLGYPYSDY